ncbi:glycosyltransferase family 2 protein [Pedobacter punctiformis]|uniref:Glycosyltransferase family 2 protein n=1 Tax=Pedobacter punctiformis TaxID=3004097 RepID=A0ABT4L4S1_9SPHI|nr:glycosyltransferase family 2 protein [Pedobacter sp. HCMS5-2]MCZ4242916.1 glycosyltransferase family 2 protein [Pedobacter sp. HCMS5-2]
MTNSKINIVLATYNGQSYIEAQINSIIAQTYSNWELLIRDDGSTDKTLQIIKEFENVDNRINVLTDLKGNVRSCQNFSILMSQVSKDAQYVMFCDQDDIWLEDKIERSLYAMNTLEKAHGSDGPLMVYGTYRMIDHNGKDLQLAVPDYSTRPSLNLLLSQNYIYGCTMLINQKLLERSIPIPSTAENHDYWLALICAINNGHFSYIKQPLLLYRQHNLNVSGSYTNASLLNRVKRIFSIDEIQSIKKRLAMFISLKKSVINKSSQNALLLDNYIRVVSQGGFEAAKFCLNNNIRRKGKIQTLLYYFNLVRAKGTM